MQPWTEARAGDGRVDGRHPGQERGEGRERGALTAVFGIDEQTPVADLAQFVEHLVGDLAGVVEQRMVGDVAADELGSEASIVAWQAGGVGEGSGLKRSEGNSRSQMARWTGLCAVWYRVANMASTCSSAISSLPVFLASSSLLPPSLRAVSMKVWASTSLQIVGHRPAPREKGSEVNIVSGKASRPVRSSTRPLERTRPRSERP